MARNIDESDQIPSDLEPERPLTRRERRMLEKSGIPHQSRGDDDTPAPGDPVTTRQTDEDDTLADEQVEDEGDEVRSGDVVPATVGRRRKRWVPALVLVIVLALVAAGGYLWWQRQNPAPAPATAPTVADQTLYLSLTTADGRSAGGMLTIARGEDAYGVLVPADLTLDVPGTGTTTIRDAQAAGTDIPGRAVSDATGVPVDGHWVFSLDALAAMVDSVGGVSVNVNSRVEANGIKLAVGEQELNGPAAATYAGWQAGGEARVNQLARSGQVLQALVAALPADSAEVEELLGTTEGTSTLETPELAEALGRLHTAAAGDTFGLAVLPGTPAPDAQNQDRVLLDVDAFTSWLNPLVPDLQQRVPGEAGRVQVKNAAGTPDVMDPARSQLLEDSFAYTYGGTAEPIQPTSIVMYSASRQTRDQALAAAKILGLPEDAVQVSDDIPLDQDIVILLGQDFATAQGIELPAPKAPDAPAEGDAAPADGDAAPAEAPAAEDAPAAENTPAAEAPAGDE